MAAGENIIMNDLQKGIIELVRSALTGEKAQLVKDFDWEKAAAIAGAHKITVPVYYGAYNSGIELADSVKAMDKQVFAYIRQDAYQDYEIEKLFGEFEANDVDYMPLKGTILKKYYPKPEMRYMSDADILIKPEQYDRIENIMQSLGYEFEIESNHEYVWQKKTMQIELHKYLIPSYNKDYFEYYGSGWRLAQKTETSRHYMSKEDFLIYIFTHLAKHYRDSGIGIKHFVDMWVYLKSEPNMDNRYIESELEKLQLLDFYKNTRKLLRVWFSGEEPDSTTQLMTQWIFSSGVFGTKTNSDLSEALKKSKSTSENIRLKVLRDEIFPPLSKMRRRYGVLKKIPILLPVMWLVRILETVLFKRKNLMDSAKKIETTSGNNVDAYQAALNSVGLDFNFKE